MALKENKITLYGTAYCGDSIMARILFKKHKVDYIDIDIDKDPDGEQIVIAHNNGNRSVPTIYFPDGDVLVEPSPRVLLAKIK
jgi:mycoredoxin